MLRRDVRRRHDDLGAVGLQHGHLLAGELVGHDEHHAVAALQRDEREPDAGVPARRLDDGAAGAEFARRLGGFDDPRGDAVLRGAAGVQVLDLGEHGGADAGVSRRHGVEADEGRVAGEVGDVRYVAHGGSWGVAAGAERADVRRAVGVVEESRGGSATTATGQGHATTVTRQARMPVSVTSGP